MGRLVLQRGGSPPLLIAPVGSRGLPQGLRDQGAYDPQAGEETHVLTTVVWTWKGRNHQVRTCPF